MLFNYVYPVLDRFGVDLIIVFRERARINEEAELFVFGTLIILGGRGNLYLITLIFLIDVLKRAWRKELIYKLIPQLAEQRRHFAQ